MRERFTITTVDNVITEESARRGDYASSEVSEATPADLGDAFNALESDCWDSVDFRHDAIICYPADYAQNMRTGDWEGREVIIAGKARELERLYDYWQRNRYRPA